MSNFSKIVIILLIVLTILFVKDKYGSNISEMISFITKEKITSNEKPVRQPAEKTEKNNSQIILPEESDKNEKDMVFIYFLALDSNDNGIYKKVQRELPQEENKLEFAIKELLKGPNITEKAFGAYSEIPSSTKLLKIEQKGNKIIIDFSSDFQYGGGTDSIYSRMMQLIKTSLANTENKKIYLFLDGKQVNFIGGEGIMITQPLNEKSLEV